MPTDDDPDSSAEPRTTQPLFVVPQPDGISLTLDFTTPGPFGDFAFTARIPEPGGNVRERVYRAYHTEEAAIFVEILQHWARVAEPDDILAGLERAETVLRFLTDDLDPTARYENDFSDLLRRGIEPLAAMNFLPGRPRAQRRARRHHRPLAARDRSGVEKPAWPAYRVQRPAQPPLGLRDWDDVAHLRPRQHPSLPAQHRRVRDRHCGFSPGRPQPQRAAVRVSGGIPRRESWPQRRR